MSEITPTEPAAPVAASTEPQQAPPASADAGLSWMDSLDKAFESVPESNDDIPDLSGSPSAPTKHDEPEPEKPKEEGSDEDDAAVKNMTPSAGKVFKEIKAEKKAALARVKELEAALEEAKKGGSAGPDPAEAERLQALIAEREQKIAEYEKELSISRIEATPEYKKEVVEPLAAILGVVQRLATKYTIPERQLMRVLEEPNLDTQGDLIAEIAANFSERDRVSLYTLGDDYSAAMSQRDELRAKAADVLKAREREAAAKAEREKAASTKEWSDSTKSVWDAIKSKLPLPTDETERQKIETEVFSQVAGLDFNAQSTKAKAFAAFSGAVVPHVVRYAKTLETKVAELEKSLQKYSAATPGAGAGDQAPPSRIDDSVGFLDAIERSIGG